MVKINQLELENVKKIKACQIRPAENGLTIIGGRNNQGKSSVLDAIAWALGGEKFRPSQAQRDGSVLPPRLRVELSNGLVAERTGKNSALKVTDLSGRKGGQQILNEFVEQLALDLPRFLNATEKEKAEILLQVIGVGDQLTALDRQESELYSKRRAVGQIADQKTKFAREMPDYPGLPSVPLSVRELIEQQQEILARNGENQRKRAQAAQLEREAELMRQHVDALTAQLRDASDAHEKVLRDLELARKDALELQDESTEELEANIQNVEETNRKIRANLDKEKAEQDAAMYADQYTSLTQALERVRGQRQDLLNGANLPLPGLSVESGALTYQGKHWDSLSGSDQLKVSTAIVRAVNPKCGFVLLDKLEQMDLETLTEFELWLEGEGLQVIATRVSTGGECSLIIEDGSVAGEELSAAPAAVPAWNPKGVQK